VLKILILPLHFLKIEMFIPKFFIFGKKNVFRQQKYFSTIVDIPKFGAQSLPHDLSGHEATDTTDDISFAIRFSALKPIKLLLVMVISHVS